ncbi:hypothetical protein T484DRAFT_1848874 [Baffinella frigidus]|nr:hypothetical protein T484DRAFT_1848874 [Cryptophyta sp. CCMP2293]
MVSSAQRFSRGMSVLLAMLTILAAEDAAAFVNVPAFSTSPAPRLRAPRSLSPSSVGMMAEGGGPSEATNNNALDMVVSRRSALRAALAASIVAASVTVPGSKFLGQAEPATAAESDPLGYATGYNVAPGKKVVLPDGTRVI